MKSSAFFVEQMDIDVQRLDEILEEHQVEKVDTRRGYRLLRSRGYQGFFRDAVSAFLCSHRARPLINGSAG
jgi:hypothetical protein